MLRKTSKATGWQSVGFRAFNQWPGIMTPKGTETAKNYGGKANDNPAGRPSALQIIRFGQIFERLDPGNLQESPGGLKTVLVELDQLPALQKGEC